MEKTYLLKLNTLKEVAENLPKTRMMSIAKIDVLIKLNMSWERLQIDKKLKVHPFKLTHDLVETAITSLQTWETLNFCDGAIPIEVTNNLSMEGEHHDLFQSLWTSFNEDQYLERIKLYDFRLSVNNLNSGTFKDRRVLDMGCGHGNFAHALINAGAKSVLGIDFGENSIRYALGARDKLAINSDKLDFKVAEVYNVPEPDMSFDAAIQNGVFHHLEDEDRAYKEMYRLLKPGGIAWIYTEGEDSIARNLFDASVKILEEVPANLVMEHLAHLGLSINKRYHLGDSLKAIYRATSWNNLTNRLKTIGFGEFKRLKGGLAYDLDITEEDPWAKEKFGEADIRLLATKL